MCFSKQRIAATSLAVQELAFHGIAAETWSVQDAYWPAASVRARKYRRRFWMRKQATFTSQDCNRLRADMEKVDWFVKLMASVGGAGK
jgi:PhoPQ-activated pathogenicity-related protein